MYYFEYYNPHPQGKLVGDCVKRALTKATGNDYISIQKELNKIKRRLNQSHFNDEKVWKEFLQEHKFVKHSFPAVRRKKRMTVNELTRKSTPSDVWVCRCAGHLVCIQNRKYWDTWDCGKKCVYTAYKLESRQT